MKLYIWEYVMGLTKEYHDGGGLVVITNRDPKEVFGEQDHRPLDLPEADRVIDVGDGEHEALYIFPDAGCC